MQPSDISCYDLGLNPDNYSNQEFALKIEQNGTVLRLMQHIIDKINGLGLGNIPLHIFHSSRDVDNDKLQIMRSVSERRAPMNSGNSYELGRVVFQTRK